MPQCAMKTVCYHFMPVLDGTRTYLKYLMPDGSKVLCFDPIEFAAFDIYILQKTAAEADYSAVEIQ